MWARAEFERQGGSRQWARQATLRIAQVGRAPQRQHGDATTAVRQAPVGVQADVQATHARPALSASGRAAYTLG